ncbi:heterogeneous nuclear ribonucleoprotein K isoform X1 [Drosophila biarmipes]|uniref:heterogeneous nuclear ribonucleoprotein K isoform X1 n=2 Tax=Drosophila biarmipes TaxID=125945 RepID=UPI0007E82764|nr:heterogeneous nuclear ribonucleoprotein K isoform X1 [Drosophila biarmipes]XP_043948381.1 heterogeneous nuclear ribonucleoprotein K isoform X1 [Drosophila biarmipes]
MKREMNDAGEGPQDQKRNRRNEETVRILIPSSIAGAVIGKGGQHIQKMRTQYKATVSVDDSQGPERTIQISADIESTLEIITEMLKYFEERDEDFDVRLLIHQSLAGCVIGKGGQKIKEIRDRIGCRFLKVFSNVAPQSTDRVVQTVGKQSQVIDAVREVITLTRDTPIKGAIHNYDPMNFDRVYADEYGGYGTGSGSTRPSQRGNNRNGGVGAGGAGAGGAAGGNGGGFSTGGARGNAGGRGGADRFGGAAGGVAAGAGMGQRDNPFINPWANGGGGDVDGFGNTGGGAGGFAGNSFGGGAGGPFGGGSFGNNGFGGGPSDFGGNSGNFGQAQGSNSLPSLGSFSQNQGGTSNLPSLSSFGQNPGGAGGLGNGLSGGSANNGGVGALGGANGAGGFNAGGGANGGPNGSPNASANVPQGHDPNNSTQVTIPKELAGAIIGKGGGRIRRIRNESSAYITIDEPLPNSNDRIITISGTPKQIQMAQYLLQQSVHENGRRNI